MPGSSWTLDDLANLSPERRAFVEAQLGIEPAAPAEPDLRELAKREKDEQVAVVAELIKAGCNVYNLSQPRATKQTAGLPDLYWCHAVSGISGWFEVKRSEMLLTHSLAGLRKKTEAMSAEQIQFRDECIRCGVPHGVGDRYDARRFVREMIQLQESKNDNEQQ